MPEIVPGGLSVSNGVIADLAGYAALECYGVVGMAAPSISDGIAKILPAHRLRRGILVTEGEAGVVIDLYIIIEHGTNLATVSANLVDQVRFTLEEIAQVNVDSVNVHVQGMKIRPSEK